MKKAEKEILIAFLGKTSNMPSETVASLFTKTEDGKEEDLSDKALDILLKDHADHVQAIKDKEKTMFDNGYKKAQVEVLSKLEKEISDKFEVKSDKKGIELIEEIVTAKTKVPELDEDKIKVHPVFTKAEKEFQKKLKEQEELFKAESEKKDKEFARKETISKIKAKVIQQLEEEIKPIFGTTDKAKQKNQIDRLLMPDIEQLDYLEQDGEIILMKEGKRLEDKHGKPISFSSFIKENASKHWEFETGTGKQGSGASNDGTGTGSNGVSKGSDGKIKWTGQLPKDDAEYTKIFNTLKTSEERIAFDDAVTEASQAKV